MFWPKYILPIAFFIVLSVLFFLVKGNYDKHIKSQAITEKEIEEIKKEKSLYQEKINAFNIKIESATNSGRKKELKIKLLESFK